MLEAGRPLAPSNSTIRGSSQRNTTILNDIMGVVLLFQILFSRCLDIGREVLANRRCLGYISEGGGRMFSLVPPSGLVLAGELGAL